MAGHVRKRGKRWYYSFEASQVDGKRKRIERVGGNTKKEAEAALRKALMEYENAGLHFEPTEISVADYMDYWVKNYAMVNTKHRTQISYNSLIETHIKPMLGLYKLKSLTPSILQGFINEKQGVLSKGSLGNLSGLLHSALDYAVHPAGFIKENPHQYVKLPKYERKERKIDDIKTITPNEFDMIVQKYPPGSDYYIPFMIGYNTGGRVGEVDALTTNDFDFTNDTVSFNKTISRNSKLKRHYIGSTKTETSDRVIQFGPSLKIALLDHLSRINQNKLKYGQHYIQQYIVENDGFKTIESYAIGDNFKGGKPIDFICVRENGLLVNMDSLRITCQRLKESLGIDMSFHSLRHTHATILLENGVDMKTVQERLGHAKLSTTMDTYGHFTKKMDSSAVAAFERAQNDRIANN